MHPCLPRTSPGCKAETKSKQSIAIMALRVEEMRWHGYMVGGVGQGWFTDRLDHYLLCAIQDSCGPEA